MTELEQDLRYIASHSWPLMSPTTHCLTSVESILHCCVRSLYRFLLGIYNSQSNENVFATLMRKTKDLHDHISLQVTYLTLLYMHVYMNLEFTTGSHAT